MISDRGALKKIIHLALYSGLAVHSGSLRKQTVKCSPKWHHMTYRLWQVSCADSGSTGIALCRIRDCTGLTFKGDKQGGKHKKHMKGRLKLPH